MHTFRDRKQETSVTLTGFLCSAPKLIFSKNSAQGSSKIKDELFTKLVTFSVLKTLNKVSWLSCGFEHCMAVTKNGKVVTWGYGASGCLGHGDYVSYT
jgi:alpha-tubulin suppressor-like RCC1 family protein